MGGAGAGLSSALSGVGSDILGGTKVGDFLGVAKPDGAQSFGQIVSSNAASAPTLSASPAIGAGGGSSMLGSSGGSSMFSGSNLLKALGTYNDYSTQKDMEKKMLAANDQAMAQLQPYAQTGTAANSALQELMGLSGDPGAAMSRIQNDPAYQFRMQQGMEGLNRNLAASGSLDSGRAMKAAQEYGQGLAITRI